MATVSLTITLNGTVAQNNDVIDTVSASLGWVEDPENLGFNLEGETKGRYIKERIIDYMKNHYKSKKRADQTTANNSDADTAFSTVTST